MQNVGLIEKIRNLPPETVSEVEDFVDFLTEKVSKQQGEELAKETHILLSSLGITEQEAATQRAALSSFSEDWDLPEMDVYDKL